jgi:mitochondrial fission protein ELM1
LTDQPASAWALTPGSAGHEVQCVGVVEALGLAPRLVRVAPRAPYAWLAPWGPAAPAAEFAPPWPDLVVASGRQAIPYARAVRRLSRGRTFVAVLQNPVVPPRWFDLVWVNEHDEVTGPNVVRTLTSPHTVTETRLSEGAAGLTARIGALPRPWIGAVLGGTSGAYRFEAEEGAALGGTLAALAAATGGSVLVTPSRRTGKAALAALSGALAGVPAWVWDSVTGDNPYFGILGSADLLVVTCDSVNMLGEAAFTGRPLFAWPLEGGTAKFRAFHEGLAAAGALRWLDAEAVAVQVATRSLATWTYKPLNANAAIAGRIRRDFAARRSRPGRAAP